MQRNQSGASLVFVLGIMLLLMAIGASVLVAASANVGSSLKQKEHSQIMILSESVHKNIMYSLQHDTADANLLSAQLVKALYEAHDPDLPWHYSAAGLADIPLDISITGGIAMGGVDLHNGSIAVESITLSFPEQSVIITPPIPAIYIPDIYDEEGNLIAPRTLDKGREPKVAEVSATLVVTVAINANGELSTTRAVYEYTGGKLSDDPDATGVSHFDDDTPGAWFEMVFTSDGYGKWRMIRYENVDSDN